MNKLEDLLTFEFDPKKVFINHSSDYHENFGYQWNKFNKLQLDSYNGSSESRDRLLLQSELNPENFKDKKVLEVGAGNGRFTEILLSFGAQVVAVDYSSAIKANYQNNFDSVDCGNLICIQSDLFDMPVREKSFDIVMCYGVIQHTGRNEDCLYELEKYLKKNSILLLDIYSNTIRHFNPWIYSIRPFFSLVKDNEKKFKIVSSFVNFVFPFQLYLISKVHNKNGLFKLLRYILYRSPNSVYGINLYLSGKISLEHAKEWSLCDTFDAWMPKHDHPVSFRKWKKMINQLSISKNLKVLTIKECGQGNCASLRSK